MRRLTPAARKLTLTVHVAAGVGWLGVHAVLVLLAGLKVLHSWFKKRGSDPLLSR